MKRIWAELTPIFENFRRHDKAQSLVLISAALLSGILSVFFAKVFRFFEGSIHLFHGPIAFILPPIGFLCSWAIIYFFAPEASGSGIPQVLVAKEKLLHGENADKYLSIRVIFAKVFSALICVGSGGAIGREGPTIQIGASVFHELNRKFKRLITKNVPQAWVISGAAAGLAAAFNTPLGGIVYAIEEFGGAHFASVRTILLAAIMISGLVSQVVLGNYLYLGTPHIIVDGFRAVYLAVAVGICCGYAGSFFSYALFKLVQLRNTLRSAKAFAILAVALGTLFAGLYYFENSAAGSGVTLIDDMLFQSRQSNVGIFLSRYLGTLVTYLAGGAGGIFSPSLAAGGSLGQLISEALMGTSTNLSVLLGMIAFLTGVTRCPFTSFVLVLEMTADRGSVFAMMVAALTAEGVCHFTNGRSFYARMEQRILEAADTSISN